MLIMDGAAKLDKNRCDSPRWDSTQRKCNELHGLPEREPSTTNRLPRAQSAHCRSEMSSRCRLSSAGQAW